MLGPAALRPTLHLAGCADRWGSMRRRGSPTRRTRWRLHRPDLHVCRGYAVLICVVIRIVEATGCARADRQSPMEPRNGSINAHGFAPRREQQEGRLVEKASRQGPGPFVGCQYVGDERPPSAKLVPCLSYYWAPKKEML